MSLWKRRGPGISPEMTEALAMKMAKELAVPQKLLEVLVGRGISEAEELKSFFSPKLKTLRDPLSIRDMPRAVERIQTALKENQKICVYADYDLDGSSGLALLFEGLKELGFKHLQYYQPKRLKEGYGVHVNAVEQLHLDGVNVIITVDVGITAHEALTRAKELGIDVIVTDHHLPLEVLPPAYAIVNPNCRDCTSGLGHLSGVGVAFYLVLALRRALGSNFDPKKLLDFFTIGTLTDMVPLIDENRSLVRHGLVQLANTTRPGLRQLLIELRLDGRELTSQDVAIQFAPKLNALSRMEIGLLPVDIFFVEDEQKAQDMISTVSVNNKKRKDLQAFAEAWALEQVASQTPRGFAWVASDKFHKGVIGLVATRIVQRFGVPAFVGSIDGEEITGSSRAPDRSGINLVAAFEYSKKDLLRFGGHAKAAGFALKTTATMDFENSLVEFFKNHQASEVEFEYDVDITLDDINDKFLRFQNFLEPFGQSFQQPRFRLKTNLVSEFSMSGGHKRLIVQEGTKQAEMVYFSPREGALNPGPMEFLVRLQKNYFRGPGKLQILIDDVKTHV